MSETYTQRLMTDEDFVAELEAAERSYRTTVFLWWWMRVMILLLVIATWIVMIVIVARVNEIRDELYRHPRIVVEVEEGADA